MRVLLAAVLVITSLPSFAVRQYVATPATVVTTTHSDTIDVLKDIGSSEVLILGGVVAISADVEAQLHALGFSTERRWGADRIGTAV